MDACPACGIPADAGFFDESSIVPAPAAGAEVVLARYQLHRNYCGLLLYFAQYSDRHARDPAEVETPGYLWQIRCNNQPRDPYLSFDRIVNPWGLSGFPIQLRLEEGARLELAVRNTGQGQPLAKIGGRILGRYWYNPLFGGAPQRL